MKFVGRQGIYSGVIDAPASKSYLQRALAIALLAEGKSIISGYSASNDAQVAIDVVKELGAELKLVGDKIEIIGVSKFNSNPILNCGESGLSTRMFSAIAALTSNKVIVKGQGSILNRPMEMVAEALSQLGKRVKTNKGKLPLEFDGELFGNEIQISGEESSQLLTGLLIALPMLKQDSVIYVSKLKSVPYIQMTLDSLNAFSIFIEHEDYKLFRIKGGQRPKSIQYHVEGDWSGAAFHLVAAAITGQIKVTNLSAASLQADAQIVHVLKKCGAKVLTESTSISVTKNELIPFYFDATDCPDLFPPLAVLASCCVGKSTIAGVSRLKHKESDRAKTIQTEFKKVGIEIKIDDDEMHIFGGPIHGAEVNSHNDHRIAMAMAILSLVSKETIAVDNFDAINKSYPNFLTDFNYSLQNQ